MKSVLIAIINFNGAGCIKKCLDSLLKQDYSAKEIIVIDNGSLDNSEEIILQYSDVQLIKNKENNGYAGAADQACHLAKEKNKKFVMILNPDILFKDDYLTKVINCFDKFPQVAAVQGKFLKYDFIKERKLNIIDSTGLLCFKNRRIIDRGQGENDFGRYDFSEDVFGVTGAAPIYRLSALEDIKIKVGENDYEYFDRDFFMYKEDIDISWRLLLGGYRNYYCHEAIAWHGRGTGVLRRFSHLEVLKSRKHLSKFTKYYSYKNQRLMQIKNENLSLLIRHFFPILIKEILITGYILLREPFLIKSLLKMVSQIPKILKKRRQIQKKMREKKIKTTSLLKWFTN